MANVIDFATFTETIAGKLCLVFKPESPTRCNRMIVVFTSAVKGQRYEMWSWFYRNPTYKNSVILFLTENSDEPSYGWYFTEVDCWRRIIELVRDRYDLNNRQLMTLGGSMGGTAALYFGLVLQVGGIVSFRPQLDFHIAAQFFANQHLEHCWTDPTGLLRREFKACQGNVPIYLNYGQFPCDENAAVKFLDTIKRSKHFTIVHNCGGTHHTSFRFTQRLCHAVLSLFFSLSADSDAPNFRLLYC